MKSTLPHLVLLPVLLASTTAAQGMVFEDASARSGLFYPGAPTNASLTVGDIDGDGFQDIVLAGQIPPRIFRNNGALVEAGHSLRLFVDVTETWMPSDTPPASIAMLGDMDNDGDPDLVVVTHNWNPTTSQWNPSDTSIATYTNTGGSFVPAASDPTLGRWDRGHAGLGLADMDVDGDLDIVFVHKGSGAIGAPQGPGFYIRNDGFPNLVDATLATGSGLEILRRHLSLVLADFSGDLLPDIHTAVDFYSDYHCHNQGGGKFTDVTTQVGATNLGSDMGLAVGDIENDGDLDIYSTNIGEGVLYLNDGAGNFTKDADAHGIGTWNTPSMCIGWGTVFADMDLDMDEDLVVIGNGNPGLLFQNDGLGYFNDATPGSGLILSGRSLVHLDIENDGDLDLVIADNAIGHPVVYRNRSGGPGPRHWLTIDPEGTKDNRDGVGTKIEVLAGGVTQTRWIVAGSSFHAAPPALAHFGLGREAVADQVRVTWPSGQVQTLASVACDQVLQIQQP